MQEHHLKTHPEVFRAVVSGLKTFELRRNDRGFEIGDLLILDEWDPTIEEPYGPGEGGAYKGYTGAHFAVYVRYILPGGQFGLDKDYVAMSIEPRDMVGPR